MHKTERVRNEVTPPLAPEWYTETEAMAYRQGYQEGYSHGYLDCHNEKKD